MKRKIWRELYIYVIFGNSSAKVSEDVSGNALYFCTPWGTLGRGVGGGGGKGGTIPGLDHSSVLVQQQESSLSGGRRTIQQF